MSLEAIIGIVVSLLGLGGVWFGRKKAKEAATEAGLRKQAEEATKSAIEAGARVAERHKVQEILDRKAADARAASAAAHGAAVAKAEAQADRIDAAASQGSKALSDAVNDDIRKGWK